MDMTGYFYKANSNRNIIIDVPGVSVIFSVVIAIIAIIAIIISPPGAA